MPKPLPMPMPFRSRAVPKQSTSEQVARARLLQVGTSYLHIGVVVGNEGEWRPPNPELGIHEAYVERPGDKGIEAYIIEVYSPTSVNPDDPLTWQGLQGRIIKAWYSALQKESIWYTLPDWEQTRGGEEGSVRIPGTILSAAGINSQEARRVYGQLSAPLSMERSLSLEDLMYIRNNCIKANPIM